MKKLLCTILFGLLFLLAASFAAAQDLDSLFLQGREAEDPGAVAEIGPELDAPLPAEPAGRIGIAQWKNGVVAGNQSGLAVILPGGVVTPGQLFGKLGSQGGGRFDTAVTLDGRTAIVTNFGDSTVYFVDITNPYRLVVKGWVEAQYYDPETGDRQTLFAEDVALSPDSKWLFVTDGGFSPVVCVIDVANMRYHSSLYTPSIYDPITSELLQVGHYYCSVAIAPDGRTVVCADYFGPSVEVLAFDPVRGTLKHKQSIGTLRSSFRPVNTAISPGGTTAVAVGPSIWSMGIDEEFRGEAGAIFQISNGALIAMRQILVDKHFANAQSAIFSNDGKSCYVLGNVIYSGDHYYLAVGGIVKFPVTARGVLGPKAAANCLDVSGGTSCLFGVDAMAIDNVGSYLYVTHKTFSGGNKYMAILNPTTLKLVKYVAPFDNWIDPEDMADPDPLDIPAGVSFPVYTGPVSY